MVGGFPEIVAVQISEEHCSHRLNAVLLHVLKHRGERCAAAAMRFDVQLVVAGKLVVVCYLAIEVNDMDFDRLLVLMHRPYLGGELVEFILSDRAGAIHGESQFTHRFTVTGG